MDPKTDLGDIDEETHDEWDYDDTAACRFLDYVFEKTKDNCLFGELYSSAAAAMFSIDHEIGLSVLFSYDYLALFHACLCNFFDDPEHFDDTNDAFQKLKQKLK
jgi:hypothetical protein